MKKIVLLLFIVWLLPGKALSQGGAPTNNIPAVPLQGTYQVVITPGNLTPEYTEYLDGIAKVQYASENSRVVGSPFLSEDFLFGVMVLHDGTQIDGQKYRYNIHADEMQFILREDTVAIYQPLKVQSVVLGDQKFIYDLRLVGKDQMEAGYFEVLEEGKASLLMRRLARIDKDEYVPTYMGGGGSKDYVYKHARFYYIKMGNQAARKIKRKRDLLRAMDDKQDEIKRVIKENKLKIRKEEDLIQIISYYNKL